MIVTDRSRIVAALNCRQLRYWGYEYGGRGLANETTSLPLLNGIAIHNGIDRVADDPDNLDSIIREIISEWKADWQDADEWFVREQETLLEGLIRVWTAYRLPLIQEEFSIVASELEIPWELAPGLVDMVRCDKILRRNSDGMLFILELKTATTCNDYWANQWIHNTQILANTLAVQEKFGETCGGVMIEGLEKGQRKRETNQASQFFDKQIQNSPLCYGWRKGDLLSPSYTATWERFFVPDVMPLEKWITQYITEDVARKICYPLLPIKPTSQQLDRWRRQTIEQEFEIRRLRVLSRDAFPLNDEHCMRYGSPCQFEGLCFTEERANDPLSGGYVWRTPHHELERQQWAKQGLEETSEPAPREDEAAAQVL